ncbi:sigma-54-dependent Fis family transcriptional regulator [Alicyclobacillus tolerans]|uniref:sigma-54 interaction domain-containing protein n=1 Tax=Alicyclobacillus tolerans TaxID=90970 RepID=UPI001F2DAEA7|nr:sigma-54-dependent Fis family transcriptional regulator [Alicyclobacillus tolerans]MCF8563653.1 sigma-54-dependent Fis family transcriptional regulator [Alicyclobacillus tolerans]
MTRVLIVGAGEGGHKLIQALQDHSQICVVCVVDVSSQAPGIQRAREYGIATRQDYLQAVEEFSKEGLDVILEVTGDASVYERLVGAVTDDTLVISGRTLRFFMLLIEDKIALIRELVKWQRELQLILDAAHDGMLGLNDRGEIALFNAGAQRLLGTSAKETLGRHVEEVFPESGLTRILTSKRAELNQVQRVNGTEIVVNRMPVLDESGAVVGAISVFRDVTELRHLAAEVTNLREIQTLLEAVIQSTQDAISVVDKDGKGILINPAYTRLTGLSRADVIGKPADVDIAEGDSMHLQVLRTKQPVRNVPLKVGPLRKEVIVDVAPILVNNELRGSVGVIHDISEIQRLTKELDQANKLLRSVQAKYTFDDVTGHSLHLRMAVEQAKRAALTPATVLLRGESGTGKELFAHAIHHASERRYHAFVRVNCAAISETLLESELFGYEEGAFTGARRGGKKGLFEEASKGTIFLDEVGELNQSTQAKLLRTLQEQEIVRVGGAKPIPIDVRLIAATHVNLEQAVASGQFREDLYYRLNVIPIVIPPLRYRKDDIPELCQQVIHRLNQAYGRNVESISEDAIAMLQEYHWPGNVRELENTLGRAMLNMTFQELVLDARHLPLLHQRGSFAPALPPVNASVWTEGTLQDIVRRAEQIAIEQTLSATHGNKTEAAKRLGISLRSLYYKLNQFTS